MGAKYMVFYAGYPYQGCWEGNESFDDFDSAIAFARKCMSEGYNILDICCRDIKGVV